ncbi:hypothetical protein [Arthrobacter sp. D2-10]
MTHSMTTPHSADDINHEPSGPEPMESSPVPGAVTPVHHIETEPERSVAVDMLLGAVAGAVGVWAMDRAGWFLYNHEDKNAIARELQARKGDSDTQYTDPEKDALEQHPQARPAGKDVAHVGVEKAARITGINVHTGQPNPAGVALHYALGMAPGAMHAVIRRQVPAVKAGNGALYGFGLFVLNDELVAPSLGLASGPEEYPWQAHARGAITHTILGVVTESVLRLFDRLR